MRLYKQKNSPFFTYEFVAAGRRFRASTGTKNERDAKAIAKAARDKARLDSKLAASRASGRPDLQIQDAALRYYEEAGAKHSGARDTLRELLWLGDHFGKTTLLSEIDDEAVARMVKTRASERVIPRNMKRKKTDCPYVSAGTVNHTTVRLQALFKHARTQWKMKFANEPNWVAHKLDVPRKTARVIDSSERERLGKAVRDDYAPFVAFAFESALRFKSCVTLRWAEVLWAEGIIRKPGKRKPGGKEKIETVPITPAMRTILESQRGHHKEFVFTFVADRSRDGRKKGQRYPLTYNGTATAWRRSVGNAKIERFGFHGVRRTRATEIWRATGDLLSVSKLLNHGDVSTTQRYIGVETKDVLAAMLKADAMHGVPILPPHTRRTKAA